MRDFVREDGLDLVLLHAAKQARTNGDERVIPVPPRREGVRLRRVVDRNFGHANAGLLRLALHRTHQPGLGRIGRLLDDFRARRPLGCGLANEQRNEGAGEANDRREDQEAGQANVGAGATPHVLEAENLDRNAQDEQDRNVGADKQRNAFEHQ